MFRFIIQAIGKRKYEIALAAVTIGMSALESYLNKKKGA